MVSLTNRMDLVANSYSLITNNGVVNLKDEILSNVTGIPPETMNTLEELADALGNNPTFFSDIEAQIDLKAPKSNPNFTGTVTGITKSMVGLSNVSNTADADKPISTLTQTALNLKAPINNPTFTGTVNGITKTMVGLENVDNTSDANKPVSTATSSALANKQDLLTITSPPVNGYSPISGSTVRAFGISSDTALALNNDIITFALNPNRGFSIPLIAKIDELETSIAGKVSAEALNGKQNTLTAIAPVDTYPILDGIKIRALAGSSDVNISLASDTLSLSLNPGRGLSTAAAILFNSVTDALDGKADKANQPEVRTNVIKAYSNADLVFQNSIGQTGFSMGFTLGLTLPAGAVANGTIYAYGGLVSQGIFQVRNVAAQEALRIDSDLTAVFSGNASFSGDVSLTTLKMKTAGGIDIKNSAGSTNIVEISENPDDVAIHGTISAYGKISCGNDIQCAGDILLTTLKMQNSNGIDIKNQLGNNIIEVSEDPDEVIIHAKTTFEEQVIFNNWMFYRPYVSVFVNSNGTVAGNFGHLLISSANITRVGSNNKAYQITFPTAHPMLDAFIPMCIPRTSASSSWATASAHGIPTCKVEGFGTGMTFWFRSATVQYDQTGGLTDQSFYAYTVP